MAQTKPVKGDINSNIDHHKKLISLAVSNHADIVIFPELSITGYEPELAKELAIDKDNSILDDFQKISDDDNITIGAGMPTKSAEGILISMIIFQPDHPREIYSKQYLHEDEYPYFVCGNRQLLLTESRNKISLAICYELSIPGHSENAYKNKSEIYIASVAKTVAGVEKASSTLSEMAKKYSMTVLMSNCVGHCDHFDCGGKSSVWNNKGVLLAALDDTNEGIFIFDTGTEKVFKKQLLNSHYA